MRRRAHLSDEELALWALVASSVKPMPGRKVPVVRVQPQDVAGPKTTKTSSHPAPEVPRASSPIKPLVPLERRMRQRVSRGHTPVGGALDLHGMRQDEAHRALLNFIHRKYHEGAGLVIIVTGKGGSSANGERGVLKRLVPHWLADPGQRRYVLGYEDAAQHHGGTGALYVRLRRLRED